LPMLGKARRTQNKMKHAANLRGITQSWLIFGKSNNDFLSGLDARGKILAPSLAATGSATDSGAALSSRLWILLNSQYIGADLLRNPQDGLITKWTSGRSVTSGHYSYAGLQIADGPAAMTPGANLGRFAEWKSSASSKVILLSDRIYSGTSDATIQSVWTTNAGDWKGDVVWGDCHADWAMSHRGFETRYDRVTNTGDNLFATQQSPEWIEGSHRSDANAMMVRD